VSTPIALRILRYLPLFKRAETLKRVHFTQQEAILGQLSRLALLEQAAQSTLASDGMLLEAVGHVVEVLREVRADAARIEQGLGKLHADAARIEQRLADLRPPRVLKTDDYGLANPEAGLLAHLYSYLPSHVALDVGAHVGEVSGRLLNAGYDVYSFEPFPPIFEKLDKRLSAVPGFHGSSVAIGRVDGEMDLHLVADVIGANTYGDVTQFSSLVRHALPEGLAFDRMIRVPVRSLESLLRSGAIPKDVSILKIDTEGYDLDVIRGMGDLQPAVTMAEFWDPESSMGRLYSANLLGELVGELRCRRYHWHLVLYRVDGSTEVSFFANHPSSISQSWGNAVFFTEYHVFAEALRWCAAVLPRTYFTA
jgi:FkbM family methyltransferase